MKHLPKVQLIMALAIAIHSAGMARVSVDYDGWSNGLTVYGRPFDGKVEDRLFCYDVWFDHRGTAEKLETIVAVLQELLITKAIA